MESNENSGYIDFRKKRIKLIKRLIVGTMIFFITLPNLFCLFLLGLIYKTNENIKDISTQIVQLKETEVEKIASIEKKSEAVNDELVANDFVFKVSSDKEEYENYTRIYLTFDDGPSKYTNELLDVLNKYDAKATFFVLAQDGYDAEYARIVNEGHTLGIHSYKHVYSDVYGSLEGFENDVNQICNFIEEKTQVRPVFYRFPGGSSNTIYKGDKNELFDYLEQQGLVYIDWNVASNDSTFGGLSKGQIANNVLKGIEGKSDAVILMHDANDKHSSIEALDIIFQSLQGRDDVVFLPITENSEIIQHVHKKTEE